MSQWLAGLIGGAGALLIIIAAIVLEVRRSRRQSKGTIS